MRDAAMFTWQVPTLDPRGYRMGYALSSAEAAASREAHRSYATERGARWVSKNQWSWSPDPACHDPWQCVYEALALRNRDLVQPMTDRIRERALSAHLTTTQAAALVLRFVQTIPYERFVDAAEPFGIRPPALVARQKGGDCDSKALLGLLLLQGLGIDSVLIVSAAHAHAMLGIAVPSAGRSFTYRGRKYAYGECASDTAPLGYLEPEFLRPNDWQVIEIASPASAR
jgi:hypothetical protein